ERCAQLAGERLHMGLRLVVEIGHGDLGAEGVERLGAAPGDRMLVGDADDEPLLALEQRRLGSRDHGRSPGLAGAFMPWRESSARVCRAIICSSSVGMT